MFYLQIYLLADEYDAFSNEYLDADNLDGWHTLRDNKQSLLKGFWGRVKESIGRRRIEKCFITGVTPLSMADHTSGFNIARNVSHEKILSALCGLSHKDVYAALKLPNMLFDDKEAQRQFKIMERYFNGYRFFGDGEVDPVFNTNTCLEYLQVNCCNTYCLYIARYLLIAFKSSLTLFTTSVS